MWIEVYDKLAGVKELINTNNVTSVRWDEDYCAVEIYFNNSDSTSSFFIEELYPALIMALHGNDVDLGALGHVKPLRNSQREEVAKRMNYLDAMSDIKNTN